MHNINPLRGKTYIYMRHTLDPISIGLKKKTPTVGRGGGTRAMATATHSSKGYYIILERRIPVTQQQLTARKLAYKKGRNEKQDLATNFKNKAGPMAKATQSN